MLACYVYVSSLNQTSIACSHLFLTSLFNLLYSLIYRDFISCLFFVSSSICHSFFFSCLFFLRITYFGDVTSISSYPPLLSFYIFLQIELFCSIVSQTLLFVYDFRLACLSVCRCTAKFFLSSLFSNSKHLSIDYLSISMSSILRHFRYPFRVNSQILQKCNRISSSVLKIFCNKQY